MTVDKAYLGLPGFENTGGRISRHYINPNFGWDFLFITIS